MAILMLGLPEPSLDAAKSGKCNTIPSICVLSGFHNPYSIRLSAVFLRKLLKLGTVSRAKVVSAWDEVKRVFFSTCEIVTERTE